MDITEKTYSFVKKSNDKNGFVPTIKQIAEELNVSEHKIKTALERLEKGGRIKITDIPRKTTIKFFD